MKSFSRSGYRIASASTEVRWVYTFFLLFVLIGFVTIAGYEFAQIGFHPQAIAGHYRGMADDPDGMAFPRSFASLLEVTHFHAFIMALLYLTLAHLFVATELKRKWKLFVISAGFLFTLLDLALPWAIRYLTAAFSPVLLTAWMGEWLAYMTMIGVSLFDLWMRPGRQERENGL